MLLPGCFLTALKDPDIAIRLGETMLQGVCDDLLRWRAMGLPAYNIAVNVTTPELELGDYARKAAALFAARQLPLSQLTVEIVESVMLDHVVQRSTVISDQRNHGVSIALDDFGTGFGSLAHLRQLVVDQIKLDRSFIAALPWKKDDVGIVRAILEPARSLGIEVIAEGIESEAQAARLQDLGCRSGQRFLFSPAVPAQQFERMHSSPVSPVGLWGPAQRL